MRKLLTIALLFTVIFSSCLKEEDSYDFEAQLAKDEQIIKDFVAANNIQDVKRTVNGLYYVIDEPGSGSVSYSTNTVVEVFYEGRLLNGSVFDTTTKNGVTTAAKFPVGGVIFGWQEAITLIQPGGKIRILVPSGLAYGNRSQGSIPANSVLDFDIELKSATNP